VSGEISVKLFKNVVRKEGDSYEDTALFVYGKCFSTTCTIERLPDGTALDHDNVFDGWYVLLNIPFEKTKKYISVHTYDTKEAPCRPKLLFRIRKIGKDTKYSITRLFVWRPIREEILAHYDDPYLSAVNTAEKLKGN
jgi:hypothetical protein